MLCPNPGSTTEVIMGKLFSFPRLGLLIGLTSGESSEYNSKQGNTDEVQIWGLDRSVTLLCCLLSRHQEHKALKFLYNYIPDKRKNTAIPKQLNTYKTFIV